MNEVRKEMAAKLQSVRDGRVQRLIVNIPPRHLKSLAFSISRAAGLAPRSRSHSRDHQCHLRAGALRQVRSRLPGDHDVRPGPARYLRPGFRQREVPLQELTTTARRVPHGDVGRRRPDGAGGGFDPDRRSWSSRATLCPKAGARRPTSGSTERSIRASTTSLRVRSSLSCSACTRTISSATSSGARAGTSCRFLQSLRTDEVHVVETPYGSQGVSTPGPAKSCIRSGNCSKRSPTSGRRSANTISPGNISRRPPRPAGALSRRHGRLLSRTCGSLRSRTRLRASCSSSTPRSHKRSRAEAHSPRPGLGQKSRSKCVRTHLAVDVATIAHRGRRILICVNRPASYVTSASIPAPAAAPRRSGRGSSWRPLRRGVCPGSSPAGERPHSPWSSE